ncbi:GNAT family N-acetyltransferase [Bacillus solimangrovi]|uniref:GNAT family N-acetyltransferase n=1 Tax=Bacillus solimangrovi TaxID=1305675 RepID=A0A1E5LE33_9BACI|nr:GNAT family N-acetyltransferase [Bacillus solimangrovi]OEH92330.1 GNAT family N-acetyltransferase [Bacillus solimangrovi]
MNNNYHVTYEINSMITPEQLSNLFITSGIKRPLQDLERLSKMLKNADITISAWEQDKLIGIARSITDYSYCCYLSDLAVDKAYQKHGIGKKLVELTQEEIGDEVALILLSSPTAMEYYPKIGFDKIDNGFKIARLK